MCHVRVVLLFSVCNYCVGDSKRSTKISVHVPENFTSKLFCYENLVAFDVFSLSVVFPEQPAISEDHAIFVCLVALV